jgi:predicted esterase
MDASGRFVSFFALALVVGMLCGCGAGATVGSSGGLPPGASSPTSAPVGAVPSGSPSGAPTTAPGTGASSTAVGPSPGPAILYEAAATPPQLVNTGIWSAPPILISGASAYRDGEYVYQDFLYDDHGADGVVYDANQIMQEFYPNSLARYTGTYTYPTSAAYGANAADLVEFRMKPTSDATAFRITLNTMLDPTLYAFTIALGSSASSIALPHGANVSEPAQVFVTVHGSTGDIIDAATSQVIGTPTVTVDQAHRQVTVLVPYSAYDTRGNTALRVAEATGLWNNATGAYLLPATTSSATVGGGAGALVNPPAFYNVAFRHTEPSVGASLIGQTTSFTNWRDNTQGTALASGDLSSLYDTVDMTKLAAGTNDDMNGQPQGVPTSGHMNRILPSHYEPFQGRDFTGCNGSSAYCAPEYGSALEPYAVYVPPGAPPSGGYPLTPLLHSLSENYNQYANTRNESQFGARNGGSIVFTTEGRGPDNWYYGLSLAEVFEAWADLERNYPIDNSNVAMTGYSMGGYATFKLGVLYPDLFGTMQPTVGPAFVGTVGAPDATANDTKPMFPSLRNIPILSWHASADELVTSNYALEEEQAMANDGLNFEWDLFAPAEHLTLTLNDEYAPAAAFIATTKNIINPPHVTYVRNPSMDAAAYDVVNDHAYWVSNIVERDTTKMTGTIDILSHGFGVGDPTPSGAQPVAGTLTGGYVAALAYTGFKQTLSAPPTEPVADTLTVTATNISAATVTPSRAKVDCNATLDVTTDGAFTLTLAGCPNAAHAFFKGRAVGAPRRSEPPTSRRLVR